MERLWEEFKLKASADARERLILHYAPLVKYVAGRVSVGLPPNIEQADLVSYGEVQREIPVWVGGRRECR